MSLQAGHDYVFYPSGGMMSSKQPMKQVDACVVSTKNYVFFVPKKSVGFFVVLNTIKSFQVFTEIYVMTRGGPLNRTTTLVYGVYENAFEKADEMGYACAIAYVLFFIIALFSAAETRFIRGKAA